MDAYIGTICLFPYDFVPKNWARCEGQQMVLSQFTPLFSILGTKYGGNGRTTFALPKIAPIKLSNDCLLHYCINLRGIFPPRP